MQVCEVHHTADDDAQQALDAVPLSVVPALQRIMPLDCVWRALRFAGYVRDSVGSLVGIANTREELVALRHQIGRGEELRFTSVGHHDDQLTTEEFFAWLRVERASRLECMAAARGRPRPGVPHPEAQPDDCDGCPGGERPDDAEFEAELKQKVMLMGTGDSAG